MNDIIRARWIKELRVTKLVQSQPEVEFLDTPGGPYVDPVALLADLFIRNGGDPGVFKKSVHSNEAFVNHRHPELLKWAGISGEFGEDPDLLTAIQLHDAGKTFVEIADVLSR